MTETRGTTTVPDAAVAAEIDRALSDLVRGEKVWAGIDLGGRRALLDRVHDAAAANADAWVTAAAAYKLLDADSPLIGEEWISGPYPVITGAAALSASILALENGHSPIEKYPIVSAPGGRAAVDVMPHGLWDRLLLSGFSAQVWMPPGVSADDMRARAGLAMRRPQETAGIGVVLGAGNITSIPILDVLYEVYANNRVVALKLNPVTDGLREVFAAVLAPLVEVGAVRILTGGADVGTYLVHDDRVTHVHMTGSQATHDAIVFGTGAAGAARRASGTPALDKPVTSELGGVSPTIVLPGTWSEADLRFQAEHVVTQRLHNGGYNCCATQVVVVSSDWPQKDRFVELVRSTLIAAPERPDYYPGSRARVSAAHDSYPHATSVGGRLVVDGLLPYDTEAALTTEYFSAVLGVLELPGTGEEFLNEAVRVANDEFAGTLAVNLIGHPRTLRTLGPALDDAIADLRYGTIGVNVWTGLGFLTARASWGAFPGHTPQDVQSGIGVVHNALLLDGPERTVLRGPFRPLSRSILHGEWSISPRPPWFVTNRTAATTGRRLTAFVARPRWSALPGVLVSAIRG